MIIEGTDYTRRTKDCMTMAVGDGEGGEIRFSILTPTKAQYDLMVAITEEVTKWEGGSEGAPFMDVLGMVGAVMSNNKEGRVIDAETLAKSGFDKADVRDFALCCLGFVEALIKSKN